MTQSDALVPARRPAIAAVNRPGAGLCERTSAATLRASGRILVTALLFLSVTLIFLVSPMALFDLGFNYSDVGGTLFEKIHPGTWIAIIALICTAVGRGNPLTMLDAVVAQKGLAIFFATWILLLIYSGLIQKAPVTPFVDTFLLPIILFLLVNDTSEKQKRTLARIIHLIMAVNALLGIFEYLTGFRLTPQTEAMGAIEIDWRSTALFGHPLANASMAGAYILALSVGGGRDIAAILRPLAIALQLVALITFGGRASLVMTLILLCGVAIVNLIRILRGTRLDLLFVAMACFTLPFVVAACVAAAQAGFFDQMLDRFVNDRGSASTRIIMFKLFEIFPLRDIVLGPDLGTLASVQYLEGINYGIESFWIGFIMTNGLAISLIFFAGLAAFCWDLISVTRVATGLLLFYFFAVASTSVSLSAKNCLFAMFAMLILTMLRREPGPRPAVAGARR
jgi:hypothetical protein